MIPSSRLETGQMQRRLQLPWTSTVLDIDSTWRLHLWIASPMRASEQQAPWVLHFHPSTDTAAAAAKRQVVGGPAS